MSSSVLDSTKNALKDVASLGSDLKKAIDLGKEQATTREGVIQTINEMSDALQVASDLIAKELSSSITEFHAQPGGGEAQLRGCFERLALRVSEPSLRLLLHEGRVCGALHKIGDRFETPFSPESVAALSFWQSIRTFFTRSSMMSQVLHGLIEGERDYLRDFSSFLEEIRIGSEEALAVQWGNEVELKKKTASMISLIREKRKSLLNKALEVRDAADAVIDELH